MLFIVSTTVQFAGYLGLMISLIPTLVAVWWDLALVIMEEIALLSINNEKMKRPLEWSKFEYNLSCL